MSRYSIVHDGKVLDFNYKKNGPIMQSFYIGDIFVGQVANQKYGGWTGICACDKPVMRSMGGFKTRFHASEFILKSSGYRNAN